MLQRIVNNILYYSRSEVQEVIYDIGLFYEYLRQNEKLIDQWHFKNVFSAQYWRYLRHYNWLKPEEINYVHQGILNLILFKTYLNLGDERQINTIASGKIIKAVNKLESSNALTIKLENKVVNALRLVANNRNTLLNDEKRSEIYKSVNWALKHIILSDEPSNLNKVKR